jgi:hypothetical protein
MANTLQPVFKSLYLTMPITHPTNNIKIYIKV